MSRLGSSLRSADRQAWLFLLPLAVGMIGLVVVPALLNLRYAATNATGLGPASYIGFGNVSRAASDPLFAASIRASLVHVAISVPLRMIIATSLALLLAAPRLGGRWYRTAVFLPTVVPDVALTLLFLWLLNPQFGPVNGVLGALGLAQPVWLAEPWPARFGVIALLLFPIGEAFLVVLAARRELNPDVYEAAQVDGASAWQQLTRVTLPMMAPLLVLLTIRDIIVVLQATYVPAYLLTDGRPAYATLYLPLYIYDQAFEFAGFGYAAMLSIVLLAITGSLIALIIALARRWGLLPA